MIDGSGRAPGARASEHVAQERMEVDATLHVRQLEGSPIPVWTESSRFAVVAIDFMTPSCGPIERVKGEEMI